MPKYKIRAEETIYAIYETEIEAANKKQAKQIALNTCVNDYKHLYFDFYSYNKPQYNLLNPSSIFFFLFA